MKSYIEPLSAAEALDVLDLYGVDTPGAFPSTEHEGCVEVEMAGHTVLLETPDSVKMLFGDDAAAALRHHASFRKDAAEIMGSALDLGDFLYNVYSGEDGIDGSGWAERLDDGLSGLVKALRDRSGWSPGHPSTRTPSMPVRDPATKGSSAATSTGSRTQASSPRRTPGSTARRR